MKVLIVGQGGREHSFAYKLSQSPHVSVIYIAPGNAGTALEKKCQNIDIKATDIHELKTFALENAIDYCLVGPEAPLSEGIVDLFEAANIPILGPNKKAAQLESSKIFCKDFLARYNIPTAKYATFDKIQTALHYVENQALPVVIKADGLASGKGVTIATDLAYAKETIKDFMHHKSFGTASSRIVIEEYLQGEEASFIVLCDGKSFIPLATSQDHKTRDEGDLGPNTGGMGAYSPAPILDKVTEDFVIKNIIEPTLAGLTKDGIIFKGFLYAGLMINKKANSVKLLEYNVRCGDPETQVIFMRLKSDFNSLCLSVLKQTLAETTIEWTEDHALGVVLAAAGYPNHYLKGDTIEGISTPVNDKTKVFHAGTLLKDKAVLTNGGRVLCVCSLGKSLAEAKKSAYLQIAKIHWPNKYYRKDIGFKAL